MPTYAFRIRDNEQETLQEWQKLLNWLLRNIETVNIGAGGLSAKVITTDVLNAERVAVGADSTFEESERVKWERYSGMTLQEVIDSVS